MKSFCGCRCPNHTSATSLGSCYEVSILGVWLNHNMFNILVGLIWTITYVSSFCDWILVGIPKLGFKVHHGGDTRFKDKGNVTSGFTKRRVMFRPPTTPSSSHGGDYLDFETNFYPRFVTPLLLWDMEEVYGTTKRPSWYSGGLWHH